MNPGRSPRTTTITRRTALLTGTLLVLAGCSSTTPTNTANSTPTADNTPATGTPQPVDGVTLVVSKSPTCGCCTLWVDHAKAHGYTVTIDHPPQLDDVFAQHNIPKGLQACHLAITPDGLLFVGHIPAPIITAFRNNPPAGARGIAVPGMPVGTPGMESGDTFQPYAVTTLMKDGSTSVYREIRSAKDQLA